MFIVTYLSNTPSVSPTLPGPANTPQCSIDTRPESQGMRECKSASREAQLHSCMLTIGRMDDNRRFDVGRAVCGNCDWWLSSTGDWPLVPVIDLAGSDDAVAILAIAAHIAVAIRNAYWMTTKIMPVKVMGTAS